ncbi:MAG: aminoacyl-tRNA hydrolase [Sandaracinaceae bacterium]
MIALVVGLGNPGPDHARQRHNVGFHLLASLGAALRPGLGGRWGTARIGDREVVLLEPHTFMNLSGRAVRRAMERFEIALEDVLVVHDDLDLPFGTVRLKRGGGAGGHNGLKSIVAECGGPGFDRLRIGIGRPVEGTVVDWVLGDFSESEGAELPGVLDDATRALTMAVADGTDVAMNLINVRATD